MTQQIEREKLLIENIKQFPNYYLHLLEYGTGAGKTFQSLSMSELDLSKKWLIVCWELTHIKGWRDEIQKHGFDGFNYELVTYASFTKRKGDYNIIFDETHHINQTHVNYIIRKNITPNKIICLSATVPKDRLEFIKGLAKWTNPDKSIKDIRIHTKTLSDLIDVGVLPEPKLNVIYTELDNTLPSEILEIKKGGKKAKTVITGVFNDRFKLMKNRTEYILKLSCTEREKYDFLLAQFDFWWKKFIVQQEDYLKFKALQFATQAKRYLAYTKSKHIELLLQHINKQPNNRCIVFTGSVKQAKELGGDNAIHSKLTKKQVEEAVKAFNSRERSKIFAVGMLREGANLVDTPYGIIGQLDNQSKSLRQMVGRLLRHENPEIFILVVRNTKDEKYLEVAIEGMNEQYINYFNIKDYNYYGKK